MIKRFFSVICIALILITALPVYGGPTDGQLQVKARSWLVYELKTHQVLASGNANQRVPIASLSKLMTCLLTLEAVNNGKLQLDQTVQVPAGFINPGGSTMKLRPGQTLSVRNLIEGLMVVSGNDCAMVLSQLVDGNPARFVSHMNSRAAQLGMSRTRYLNPTGLPDPKGENTSCAGDLKLLTQYLLDHYSDTLLPITSARSLDALGLPDTSPSTNTVLQRRGIVDGLKTGHTDAAGYCMVLTMPYPSKEGYRLVSIALGTANETARDAAAVAQLDWVMDNYEVHTFASTEDNYSLGLWGGLDGHEVKASPERYWDAFVRKDSYKVQVVRQLPALLPLKMGDVVGAVHVTFEDGTEQSMPLKSKTEILELTVTEQLHAIIQDVGTWWEGKDPS